MYRSTLALLCLVALLVASPSLAQTSPSCPEDPSSYGPDFEPGVYERMMTDPLPDALARIADCEVALWPAETALTRARYSDDPALRPALRRVVDAWRAQNRAIVGLSYVALAALGERPDYFVEEAERAVADGLFRVAEYAALSSAFFPDSSRYDRLRALSDASGANLFLGMYWDDAESPNPLPYDESGYRVEISPDFSVQEAVDGVIESLFDIGVTASGDGRGVVLFTGKGYIDTYLPANIYATVVARALGVADPDGVRAAIERSPVWTAEVARRGGPSPDVEVIRRMVLSAMLPGESLVSDTFDPPSDRSLLDDRGETLDVE